AALKLQQPGFGNYAAWTAVAMQAAIRPEHAVTGDDEGHGVGGDGSTDCPRTARLAQLPGNVAIGARLSVGDGPDEAQDARLERRKRGPVDLDVEVAPLALEIFDDLDENWLRPLLINLGGGRREMLPHRFLRCLHQHGDKPGGGERHPDRPQPLVVDAANP